MVSSRTSGQRVEANFFEPASELVPFVQLYWRGRWDLRGQAPHVSQLLSDPSVHIVFEKSTARTEARLVGVWTELWSRKLEDRGLVRAIKIRPGGVGAFIHDDAHRFTNRIVPLDTLFDGIAALTNAVLEPDDDAEAFHVLETWLIGHIRPTTRACRSAIALVDRIATDLEITTVERLSAASGLTVRALQRLFREHVGASPKWVIRRNRLQEVALRLERGGNDTLATLAATLGYTDQAHLARDFKSAVGKSPSAFSGFMSEDT